MATLTGSTIIYGNGTTQLTAPMWVNYAQRLFYGQGQLPGFNSASLKQVAYSATNLSVSEAVMSYDYFWYYFSSWSMVISGPSILTPTVEVTYYPGYSTAYQGLAVIGGVPNYINITALKL
jgi:hypothetical protein